MKMRPHKKRSFEAEILTLMIGGFAFSCSLQIPCLAQVESLDQLPLGYYIYLGPSPGNYPKQKFSIEEKGRVIWHGVEPKNVKPPKEEKQPDPPKPKENPKETPNDDATVQWEENRSGIIKWKPHPITNIPRGVAQLETDFTLGPGYSPDGILRYKLRLYRIEVIPSEVQVRFLDKNGFKLMDFNVDGFRFPLCQ